MEDPDSAEKSTRPLTLPCSIYRLVLLASILLCLSLSLHLSLFFLSSGPYFQALIAYEKSQNINHSNKDHQAVIPSEWLKSRRRNKIRPDVLEGACIGMTVLLLIFTLVGLGVVCAMAHQNKGWRLKNKVASSLTSVTLDIMQIFVTTFILGISIGAGISIDALMSGLEDRVQKIKMAVLVATNNGGVSIGGTSELDAKDYKLLHKSKADAIEGLLFGGVPVLCVITLIVLAVRAVTCKAGERGSGSRAVKDIGPETEEADTETQYDTNEPVVSDKQGQ